MLLATVCVYMCVWHPLMFVDTNESINVHSCVGGNIHSRDMSVALFVYICRIYSQVHVLGDNLSFDHSQEERNVAVLACC